MTDKAQPSDTSSLLARSLFAFVFVALVLAGIVLAMLVLSPVPTDATFAQIRTGIIIGFGLFCAALFAGLVALFRASPEQLEQRARWLLPLLQNRLLIGVLLFVLLEINFFAFITLGDVAPTITNPAKFLLVTYSLLFLLLVVVANWERLNTWLNHSQAMWASIGIALTLLVALFALNWINSRIFQATGIEDNLRARFDYRHLIFMNEGDDPALARAFWQEQNQMKARWSPYTYWTLEPFAGEYINVNELGLRATTNFVESAVDAPDIFVFGGSTAWGEGARDAYTIPSHLAQLLHDEGTAARVMNYAQTGYVSMQDMLMLQNQLLLGNAPDIAIFYQGFNDIFSAYDQQWTGLIYQEDNRYNDFYAGRLLTEGEIVLRRPNLPPDTGSYPLFATPDADPAQIVERWLNNTRMAQTLAKEYGVNLIVVWQPAFYIKQSLTPPEATIREESERITPGLLALYGEADALLRQRIEAENIEGILVLSELFKDETDEIFYDYVHVNELANRAIAQAILPEVQAALGN
jgi:lysophospholipase L1-like esterase